jgi:hypothetical protein
MLMVLGEHVALRPMARDSEKQLRIVWDRRPSGLDLGRVEARTNTRLTTLSL